MLNELLNFFDNKTLYYGLLIGLGIILFSIILIIVILTHKNKNKLEKTIMIKKVNGKNVLEENNNNDSNIDEVEKMKAKLEIQKMIDQMQDDLDNKIEQAVVNFEQEQEEKAIISYQELLKNANKKIDIKNEVTINEKENFEESILENIQQDIKENIIEIEETEIENDESAIKQDIYTCGFDESDTKKFKSTDFISPVYGILKDNSKFPHIPRFDRNVDNSESVMRHERKDNVENSNYYNHKDDFKPTFNSSYVSKEIKKNEEFLKSLKEFRKNL